MLPFGVAGDEVVLIDALGVVHVYDIHTGKALPQSHRFAERASRVCAPREHPGKLWLTTSDGHGWLLDPATAKPTALPQPRSCLVAYCWNEASSTADSACDQEPRVVPGLAAYGRPWTVTTSSTCSQACCRQVENASPGSRPAPRPRAGCAGSHLTIL